MVEFDAKLSDGVSRDGQGEGTVVVLEEPVEAASDAVVIERVDLWLGESEQAWYVLRRPLADAVEGLAGEEQVFEQDHESEGGIDAASSVLWREIGAEELFEAEAFDDAIEDRKQPDTVGVEVVSIGFGAMSDLGLGLGSIRCCHGGHSGGVGRFCDEELSSWDRGLTGGRAAAIAVDIIVPGEETSSGEGLRKIVR